MKNTSIGKCLTLLLLALLATTTYSQAKWGGQPAAAIKVTAAVQANRLEVTYTIPAGQHITRQPELVFVKPQPVAGLEFGNASYSATTKTDEQGNPLYAGTLVISCELRATQPVPAGTPLNITVGWQACLDSGTCFAPQTTAVTVSLPEMAGSLPKTAVPPAAPSDRHTAAPLPPATGLWHFLLLAFLGGLILNLMPCVLPVLSIKLLGLLKSADHSAGNIRNSALAYTGGVLLSFAVLAAVVIVLKAGGAAVGWGFQFQNPVFVMALLVVIWVFALSLFDLFMIRAPGMQAAAAVSAKSGLAGAFLGGVFAVLLATPCTAPLLGAALGFAFAQPAPVIMLFFIVVGLGLAFPFLLAGFFPRTMKLLPKPGEWMNTFRALMGFLLLATVIWLLGVLQLQIGQRIMGVLAYLLVLAFACWLYGRLANPAQPLRQQWLFTALALAVAVGGWFWLVDLRAAPEIDNRTSKIENLIDPASGWERFTPDRVAALRQAGTPVFVDFGAEWCLTCKTNEIGVLYTAEIQAAFRQHGVVPLRGDYTRKDPVIAAWLTRHHRAGVPLYLYYAANAAEPVLLPELLTKQLVLKLLK